MPFLGLSPAQLDAVFRTVINGDYVDPRLLAFAQVQAQVNLPTLVAQNQENYRAAQAQMQQEAAASQAVQEEGSTTPHHQQQQQKKKMEATSASTNGTTTQPQPMQGDAGRQATAIRAQMMQQATAADRQAKQQQMVQWVPSSDNRLISDARQLAHDDVKQNALRAKWLTEAPMPENNDRTLKILWLRRLEQAAAHDTHESPPGMVEKVAAKEFFQHAPSELTIEIFCPDLHVETLRGVNDAALQEKINEAKVLEIRDEQKGTGSSYLQLASIACSKSESMPKKIRRSSYLQLASIACSKSESMPKKIRDAAGDIGLVCDHATLLGSDLDLPDFFGIQTAVGENLYYSITEGGAAPVVQIVGTFSALTGWRKELEALKAQTESTDDPMIFVLVEKPGDDKAGPPDAGSPKIFTAKTHYALWLPKEFQDELQRVRGHFHGGIGESIDIQHRLQKHNLDAAALKLHIFKFELQQIKNMKNFRHKFPSVLALTMAVTDDSRWMTFGDVAAVAEQMKILSSYWRNVVLQKTDAELGLVGLSAPGKAEARAEGSDSMSPSRTALLQLLQYRALGLEYLPEHSKIRLNFMPKPHTKKRKRKTTTTTTNDTEAKSANKNQKTVTAPETRSGDSLDKTDATLKTAGLVVVTEDSAEEAKKISPASVTDGNFDFSAGKQEILSGESHPAEV